MNILHVIYLYNQIKDTSGYGICIREPLSLEQRQLQAMPDAKKTIKLINSVADVINNDRSINGKIKVVFIEDYRVSNAELIFAAADVIRADFYSQQGGIRYR